MQQHYFKGEFKPYAEKKNILLNHKSEFAQILHYFINNGLNNGL